MVEESVAATLRYARTALTVSGSADGELFVLGRDGGVMFVPPQLAQKVVEQSEITQLRDRFGHQRLREGKYTAGQIDARWVDAIESDFTQWLRDNVDKLPVAKEQVLEIIKRRQ